jgi:hypothetical protein
MSCKLTCFDVMSMAVLGNLMHLEVVEYLFKNQKRWTRLPRIFASPNNGVAEAIRLTISHVKGYQNN